MPFVANWNRSYNLVPSASKLENINFSANTSILSSGQSKNKRR